MYRKSKKENEEARSGGDEGSRYDDHEPQLAQPSLLARDS
jgi:hypothetical protein